MKIRQTLACLTWFFCALPALPVNFQALQQVNDTVFMGNDTLLALDNMLSKVCYEGASDDLLFDSASTCRPSDCVRGYRAKWLVADSLLYVTQITSCCFAQDSLTADLKKVFPQQYADNRALADWTNGTYRFNQGRVLLDAGDRTDPLYEKEFDLQIANGKIIKAIKYDNSDTRISPYAHNSDSLYTWLYTHIVQDKVSDGLVIAIVSGDENGKVDSVRIVKGADPIINAQIEHALRTIPRWNVIYKRGKFMRTSQVLKIFINEQRRRQYAR
ncbi:MAG: hypothetical protein J5808_04970 [Paludibacteraceae bacterium]|nr:hypothetical protein [Paludibacteraceae bacterium]